MYRFGGTGGGSYGGAGKVIANPTLTGPVTGGVATLYSGGLPFIVLSSGSVAANGAISAITALPVAYPAAYCWFPANALATTIAAGWHYCTFSTTTAGVAFLNTYTSGAATIPASPTAVTDGKGAFTGSTSEVFGPTITVPALAANSQIRIGVQYTVTNNANAKTVRLRLSGNSGTVFSSATPSSIAAGGFVAVISNTGATNAQISSMIAHAGLAPTVSVLGTVDTSVATTLVHTMQKGTATDQLVLLPPTVELVQ